MQTAPQDFAYARELRELFAARSDLEHADGTREVALLESAFRVLCANYEVSCERATWQEPWTTRGDAGKDLAHALATLDRVYAVWLRHSDGRSDRAMPSIDEARRGTRDLLFAREHAGKKPAHRDAIIAGQELRYARSLIEDAPPGAVLDKQIAVITARWPDAPTTAYPPSADDFADLYFAGRLLVAHDLVARALDAIRRDRAYKEEHGNGPLSDAEGPLGDVRDQLEQLGQKKD